MDASRCGTGRRLTAVVMLTVLAVAASASATEAAETGAGAQLGVFAGGADPAAVAGFEHWLGRDVDFVVDFDSKTGYTTSDNIAGAAAWDVGVWRSARNSPRNLLFSVPLSTDQDRSLANVAAGRYDASYEKVAVSLARSYPRAIVRIGWEFNGDWYPWAAKGRTDDYVAAFRRVAGIFRAASPGFTLEWCPSEGNQQFAAQDAWPGDDVVDQIGVDVYDSNWSGVKSDPARRWSRLVDEDHGLAWYSRFAGRHSKPLAFPEWATGGNHTGDNPYFITQMNLWMRAHHVALQAYWDSDASYRGRLAEPERPNAAAAYRQAYGRDPQ